MSLGFFVFIFRFVIALSNNRKYLKYLLIIITQKSPMVRYRRFYLYVF